MCGRYRIIKKAEEIEERFDAKIDKDVYAPNPDCAPSQHLPVIASADPRAVPFFTWGLIPSWAKDPAIGSRLINARAESLAEKPAFNASLKYRRCVVPADGFYEWKREGSRKFPFLITLADERLFAFAGLWAEWFAPDGSPVPTFTIVTTEPNELILPIHHRMPAILRNGDERKWLDMRYSADDALRLLAPYPPELMNAKHIAAVPPPKPRGAIEDSFRGAQ